MEGACYKCRYGRRVDAHLRGKPAIPDESGEYVECRFMPGSVIKFADDVCGQFKKKEQVRR